MNPHARLLDELRQRRLGLRLEIVIAVRDLPGCRLHPARYQRKNAWQRYCLLCRALKRRGGS